jgi:hypothetical protein
MRADTTFDGRAKRATGWPRVSSRTNARHSGAAASRDVAGSDERGIEWSLLPIQMPTAYPGSDADFGFGRKP